MPTTRRRRRQEAREPLQASTRTYFETGSYDAANAAAVAAGEGTGHGFGAMMQLLIKRRTGHGHDVLWREHGDEILAAWIARQPGTRPWGWWEWSAPEPRRRLGGIGTPKAEVLAYAPRLEFGIPADWVASWEVDYYTGRARDVHGEPIGTKYREGHFRGEAIDPDDPPTYESEAVYLGRLDLLTAPERRALPPDAFEPEVVMPAAEDAPDDDDRDETEN